MDLYDIPDFYGYKADINGNIYSMLKQGCRNKYDESKWLEEPKLLNVRETKNGYGRVYMRRDSTNKREDVYIHRIIAEMFIENFDDLSDVNHIDSNRLNNNVNNLEWMTHKDNLEHGFKYGYASRNELGQFAHK